MLHHNPSAVLQAAGWTIAAVAGLKFISVLNRGANRPIGAPGKRRASIQLFLCLIIVSAGLLIAASA